MRAIRYRRYGSPDVMQLEEIDTPEPGPGEVLVRVRGASANPYDWHFVRGEPYFMRLLFGLRAPRRSALGVDFAGVVVRVGAGVDEYREGDAVFGLADGAFAEHVCAPVRALAPKPRALDFDRAAAVPLAASTALQGLRDAGGLRAGERVLIVGASGGVGTFAVQLAKHLFGAHVTAVCGADSVDRVRSLGADAVIDYRTHDFTESADRYDLILQLGGQHSPARLRRVLARNGRLVLSSGESDGKWLGPMVRILQAAMMAPFVAPQRLVTLDTKRRREDLVELAALIDAGKLEPVVDRTFPLAQAADAVRHVERGHPRGKVLVSIDA